MAKQRCLVLDIETRPKLAYTFELKDTTIALNAIVEDECIIAWSAKWLNEPINTIKYMDLRNGKYPVIDDSSILRPIHKMMREADIIIGQNSRSFDVPKLNARFDMNGLKPLTHFAHYDIYLLSRRVAAYTSQKLEYVAEKLNKKYKKLSHQKFPGLSLWMECLNGNREAWDEMKKYNIQDTLSTEERCNLVRNWAPKVWPDLEGDKCGSCGKAKIIKVKCHDCGKWDRV
jgi:DNA polymerase elongation subunit (family B)